MNTDLSSLSAAAFSSLRPSPRMPVLFLGHGNPMNAIEDNPYRQSWQALGQQFGPQSSAAYPVPQLILCISAHWLTRGWQVTAMEKPRTIHDFGGFPQTLFDQQYPAPGAPEFTRELAQQFSQPPITLDHSAWGFDHGAWSVLKPMFPDASIPLVQLSMDYDRPASEHFALGRQLAGLRDYGVLIIGSGNVVHNLRAMKRDAAHHEAYDWAIEFDRRVEENVQSGNLAALQDFQTLGPLAQLAHPTFEHYLPILYAAGAASVTASPDRVRCFNTDFQGASISMRSMIWN